jgi:hypothetical protein
MSDVLSGAGQVKRGSATAVIDSTDLFDKIINLKFVRKGGSSFVIHSDYEPVYYADGTMRFKPCVFKPQIKVNYRQVANEVAIKVDIEVTNLFMYAKNSTADKALPTDIYQSEGDPVMQIIVQMGYRAQFPDWTDEVHRQPGYADRFFDLLNSTANTAQEAETTYRQIIVEVLASWPSGYPPDQVSYFKGIIGSVEDGLRWKLDEEEMAKGLSYEKSTVINPETGEAFGDLEWVLWNYITRRFIRSDVLHIASTEVTGVVGDGESGRVRGPETDAEYAQTVLIYGYKDYDGPARTPDRTWTELAFGDDGLLLDKDAEKFGVRWRVSKYLRNLQEPAYTSWGPEDLAVKLTALRTRRMSVQQSTLGGQLRAIKEVYNKLRWYQLADGSFYFYSVDEGENDLFADPVTLRNQEQAIRLPAIYEISIAGLRVIKCPFIAFVSPMTTVLFRSRYSIGSLVGFYYHPGKENDAFLVLQASISFDTTGEENMMELSCTDIPAPAAPQVNADGSAEPALEVQEAEPIEERTALWAEYELTISAERNHFAATFADIAKHYLYDNRKNPLTNESYWEEEPTLARMLEDLKAWNEELFAGYKDGEPWQEPLYEDRTYFGETVDFHIPNLLPGDRVKFRIPYRPDYPGDEEALP